MATECLFTLADFKVGDRLQVHAASDLFMRGIRFVTVTHVGRICLTVQADGFKHALILHPRNVSEIVARQERCPVFGCPNPTAPHVHRDRFGVVAFEVRARG